MRSIGKVNIRKLRAICQEELNAPDLFNNWPATGYAATVAAKQRIQDRIPESWLNSWECAWSEVDRIISDEISAWVYRKPGQVSR